MNGLPLSRILTYGLFLLVAGGYAVTYFGAPAPGLAVGKKAPGVVARLSTGETLNLKQAPGRTVVVTFWASWCVPCRQEAPILNGAQADALVVGISLDDADERTTQGLAKDIGIEFPIVASRADLPGLFGVQAVPTTYVIAADGTVVFAHAGALTETDLKSGIEAANTQGI